MVSINACAVSVLIIVTSTKYNKVCYIWCIFGGRFFQQTVGIPMGTNCAPLLADLFLVRMRQTSYRGFSRKTKRS